MRLFRRKSERERLRDKYKKLIEEAYQLSHSNRTASDLKRAEAEEVLNQIDLLSRTT